MPRSIQLRIVLALTLPVLIFLICVSWVGLLAFRSGDTVGRLLRRDLVFQKAVDETYAQGLQVGQAIRNICLDPANPKAYENLDAAELAMDKALKQAGELAPDGSAGRKVENLVAMIGQRRLVLSKVRRAAVTDNKAALVMITKQETPLWRSIKEELFELRKLGEQRTLLVGQESEEASARVLRAILLAGVLSLSTSLVLGWRILAEVRREFRSLEQGIACMQSGDLGYRFGCTGAKEIAAVGAALNGMLAQFSEAVGAIHVSSREVASTAETLTQAMGRIGSAAKEVARSAESQKELTGGACFGDDGVVGLN